MSIIGYFLALGGVVLAIIQVTPKWRIIIIFLVVVTGVIRVKFFSAPTIIGHLAVLVILSLYGYGAYMWNSVFDPWIKKMKM